MDEQKNNVDPSKIPRSVLRTPSNEGEPCRRSAYKIQLRGQRLKKNNYVFSSFKIFSHSNISLSRLGILLERLLSGPDPAVLRSSS